MFPAAFSSPRHHGNVSVDLRGGTPQARMCKSRRFLIALAVPRFSTSRRPLARTSETKGHWQIYIVLVPLFDLKFLIELAASCAGTSNRRH
jgi:hypothetical protein